MAKKVSHKRAARARAQLTRLRKGGVTKHEQKQAQRMKHIIHVRRKQTGRVPKTGRPVKPKAHGRPAPKHGAPRRTIRHPATAGVRAPTRNPFMSGEDILNSADKEAQWSSELTGMGQDASEMASQHDYQKAQLDEASKGRMDQVDENAIGRGIFRSSIRQGSLTDISRDVSLQKSNLDSQLQAINNRLATRRQQIASIERPRFQAGQNQRMIENAQQYNEGRGFIREPTAAYTTTAPGRPAGRPGARPLPRAVTPRAVTPRARKLAPKSSPRRIARSQRLARAYMGRGQTKGKKWRPVISRLGYDPRHAGGLRFR